VTAVAGHVTAGRTAPALPAADPPGPGQVPRLADGVELLGEYQGSGYAQPPSLVRRADGQVIQMSPLLYRVACRIDGSRDPEAIADLVSGDLGRSLTAGQVRYLITAKLLPPGIVAARGAPAAPPKASPLFALRVLDGAQDCDDRGFLRHWGCRWEGGGWPACGVFVGGGTVPMRCRGGCAGAGRGCSWPLG
jgi:hypothetical protein